MINFTGVNATAGNILACNIRTADGSILTVAKIITQTETNANESIDYTVLPSDASRINKAVLWSIESCGISVNKPIYTHLNTWSQFSSVDDDGYRALDCWLGFSGRYFNNTEICNYEGDVAFAVSMAKGVKVEGNCHDNIDNDGNGQVDCNDRYCQGISYECATHTPITGG